MGFDSQNSLLIEAANLERWISSREPATWAWKHFRGWEREDWLALLHKIRSSEYWPLPEAAAGQHLEGLRNQFQAIVAEYERARGRLGDSPAFASSLLLNNAAMIGNNSLAKILLDAGADVNAEYSSETPLYRAVKFGHKQMVELLLAHHAYSNAISHDDTPLGAALRINRQDIMELLLAHGADINAKNKYGQTLLAEVVKQGPKSMAEFLLAAGADVEAQNAYGETPLHLAVICGRKEIAELLLSYLARVNAHDAHGQTPLHIATLRSRRDIAELLRRHGARLGVGKKFVLLWQKVSATLIPLLAGGILAAALHWVAPAFAPWGVGLLVAISTFTALCIVLLTGDERFTAYRKRLLLGWALLAFGVAAFMHKLSPWFSNWVAACTFGTVVAPVFWPLMLALPRARSSRQQISEMGAAGQTPLTGAAGSGDLRRVKALITQGADLNARNHLGMTALMLAAERGDLPCVQALIAGGAEVNAQEELYCRKTALIYAAEKGSAPCLAALIEAGADGAAKDHIGETALDLCRDQPRLAGLLESANPAAQASILERWKSSGEPEAWVRKRRRGWNQEDWLRLVRTLRKSRYWPMNEGAIRQHLESLRDQMQS